MTKNKAHKSFIDRSFILTLVLSLTFIFIFSSVSALTPTPASSTCYQETANASHATDGWCNLNYTGGYAFLGSWNGAYGLERCYDGDWTGDLATGGCTATSGQNASFYVNYTKPIGATSSNWKIRGYVGPPTSDWITINIPINSSCFSGYSDKIVLRRNQSNADFKVSYECHNSTRWVTLLPYSQGTHLSEEGMNWSVIAIVENNQSFSPSVQASTTNPFLLNITYDTSYFNSISATLHYNGTNYAAVKSTSGKNTIFNTTATSPANAVTSFNVSFYWNISATNATSTYYYITNSSNQTITGLNIDDCTNNHITIINFTNKDQDALTDIASTTFNVYVKIGDSTLTSYGNYSGNRTGNSMAICVNATPTNYRMDLTLQWTTSNYFTQFYNMQNYALTSSTIYQNVTLYGLLSSGNQECQINLKDNTFSPLSNAVVQIERQYVSKGTYYTTEIPLTDSSGSTVGHFVTTGNLYNMYVKRNGELMATINNINPYVDTTFSPCVLTYNIPASSTNPTTVAGVHGVYYYNQNYNADTSTYSFSFSSADGNTHTIVLRGTLLDNYQNKSVCAQVITSTSGTPSCVVSGAYQNQTIVFKAYSDNQLLFTAYGNTGYSHSGVLSKTRYIIAALLIPAAVLMAGSAASVALIAFIIGLIFCTMIFLIDTQSMLGAGSFIVWFIIAAVTLIIKIVAGGVKNG